VAELSGDGAAPLVVRSSSTIEDALTSSLAGQFVSKVGVAGWDAFVDAVVAVQSSAHRLPGVDGRPAPMAVLCQRALPAVVGGVLFGLDPVTGDRHHFVVESVPGGPHALVDGSATVEHVTVSRAGRAGLRNRRARYPLVDRRQLRRLAHLGRRARRVFGCPQDVEWAIDGDDGLWMLQSRPVTAAAERSPRGAPLLGPGPVGETLPDPLHPLEIDLWVAPLREGMAEALRITRAVPPRRLSPSALVPVIQGWVACDLETLGVSPRRRSWLTLLSLPRGSRRLASAWRVGRLRAALPALAEASCRRDRPRAQLAGAARHV